MGILFDTYIQINEISQIMKSLIILFCNCIKCFNETLIKTTYPTKQNIFFIFKYNLTLKEKFICTLLT